MDDRVVIGKTRINKHRIQSRLVIGKGVSRKTSPEEEFTTITGSLYPKRNTLQF